VRCQRVDRHGRGRAAHAARVRRDVEHVLDVRDGLGGAGVVDPGHRHPRRGAEAVQERLQGRDVRTGVAGL